MPAGVGLIAVTYGLARFGLGLFAPQLETTLGLTSTGIGIVLGSSFAGYAVALVVAGPAVDLAGARATATVSAGLAVVGTGGIAAASGAGVATVAATLGGMSTGFASASMATAVAAGTPAAERDRAQTVVNAGTSIGLMVAAPVTWVAGAEWRLAWWLFAGLSAMAGMVANRGLVGHGRAMSRRPASLRLQVRLEPLPGRLVATSVVLGASTAPVWAFGREQVESVSGLGHAAGSFAWFVLGVGGLVGAAAGAAAKRFGLSHVLTAVWVMLGIACLALTGHRSAGFAFVLVAAFGAAYMALTGLVIVWAAGARPARPGAAVASAFLVLAIAQSLTSPLAGLVVEHLGADAAFLAAGAVAVAGLTVRPASKVRASVRARSSCGGARQDGRAWPERVSRRPRRANPPS